MRGPSSVRETSARETLLWLLLAAALLVLAGAREGFPAEPAPDPLEAETFATTWLWREVVWSNDTGRAEGWGGRGQAQLGLGRLGLAVRADVGGLPEAFSIEEPSTFTSASGYLAGHWNLVARRRAVLGVTAFAGRAISLEGGPTSAPTVGRYTAGAGVRVAAPGAAGYLAIGTHQALGGLCVLGTVHAPLTSRLAAIADGAVSAEGRAYVRLGIAVLVAEGGR